MEKLRMHSTCDTFLLHTVKQSCKTANEIALGDTQSLDITASATIVWCVKFKKKCPPFPNLVKPLVTPCRTLEFHGRSVEKPALSYPDLFHFLVCTMFSPLMLSNYHFFFLEDSNPLIPGYSRL